MVAEIVEIRSNDDNIAHSNDVMTRDDRAL